MRILQKLLETESYNEDLIYKAFSLLRMHSSTYYYVHYTHGIKGCGQLLEKKIQEVFMSVLDRAISAI